MRIVHTTQGDIMSTVELADEAATLEYGRQMAQSLSHGAVIALQGELGAGKTTFTKGLAEGFGVHEVVTSPTFVLMKLYDTHGQSDITRLCHIDAYRLTSAHDLIMIGAEEYLTDTRTVTVIEWPERVEGILPDNAIKIVFEEVD